MMITSQKRRLRVAAFAEALHASAPLGALAPVGPLDDARIENRRLVVVNRRLPCGLGHDGSLGRLAAGRAGERPYSGQWRT